MLALLVFLVPLITTHSLLTQCGLWSPFTAPSALAEQHLCSRDKDGKAHVKLSVQAPAYFCLALWALYGLMRYHSVVAAVMTEECQKMFPGQA